MSENRVQLVVWVDVQCAWCYLNQRRVRDALAQVGFGVDLTYRFFALDPNAEELFDKEKFLREVRRMDEQTLRAGEAKLNALGEEYGIVYDWDAMRPTNSQRAHRMLAWAQQNNLLDTALDRLFRGYFSEGAVISDRDQLLRLALEAGLDAGAARDAIDGTEFDAGLDDDRRQALRLGVNGVPFMVIDDRYALSGAQSVAALVSALEGAHAEGAHA